MTSDTLAVLLGGTLIGHVSRDRRHRLRFAYEPAWRTAPQAIPLSLSMPLASPEHDQGPIEAFMWGLLPDSEQVLDRWARLFHVSPRNPFALLSHVGEDCAGAVQFVTPARIAEFTDDQSSQITWLSEQEVANRLRVLRADHASGRIAGDTGQFSLAGAQAKTALLFEDGRWGIPSGRTPTTHILKPPIPGFDGHVENEHLCLALAHEVGLAAATSQVKTFEDEIAIVVERYDRYRTADLASAAAAEAARAAALAAADPSAAARTAEAAARAVGLSELARRLPLLRPHQEDFCQALGTPPTQKYQSDGGPAPATMTALLRIHGSRPAEDVGAFVDALLFNWLIAGTDAHAKNYSLLLGARGQARLAPLYDLASALPYPQMDQRRLRLAMKIGGVYSIGRIAGRHVHRLAEELGLDASSTLSRAQDLTERVRSAIDPVCDREKNKGLSPLFVDRLREQLSAHVERCKKALIDPANPL